MILLVDRGFFDQQLLVQAPWGQSRPTDAHPWPGAFSAQDVNHGALVWARSPGPGARAAPDGWEQ